VEIKPISQGAADGYAPVVLSVTATARMGCRGPTASSWGEVPDLLACSTTRLSAQFRERQAFSFMYFDNFQTLDPRFYEFEDEQKDARRFCLQPFGARQLLRNAWVADPVNPPPATSFSCQEVPYFGGSDSDVVSGPVHTNDESILVCGDPDFSATPVVQTRGIGTSGWYSRIDEAAQGFPLAAGTCDGVVDPLPLLSASSPRTNQAEFNIPADPTSMKAVAVDLVDEYAVAPGQWLEIVLVADTDDQAWCVSGACGIPRPAGITSWYNTRVVDSAGTLVPGFDWVSHKWPGRGVLHVTGHVRVRGKTCAPISIAAQDGGAIDGDGGQIEINGNLTTAYAGRAVPLALQKARGSGANRLAWDDLGLAFDDTHAADPPPCRVPGNSMIGLVADHAVTVVQEPLNVGGGDAPVSDRGPLVADVSNPWQRDRYIEAAVVARGESYPELNSVGSAEYTASDRNEVFADADPRPLGGSFSVDDWYLANVVGPGLAPPKLWFYGAVWANTRGAYGGIELVGPGVSLTSGFIKDFRYDSRLKNQPPPYLVTASQAAWVRSDVVEQVVVV
jgi:hypothetical protein